MTKREESDYKLIKEGSSYMIGHCHCDYPVEEIAWDDCCGIILSDSYTAAGLMVRSGRRYAYFYYYGGGGGCPIYYKSDMKPFTFDDIRVVHGDNYGMKHGYVGYLAFRKCGKWGVYRIADIGEMVYYLEGPIKLIVPCQYRTFQEAINQIHEPAYDSWQAKWVTYQQLDQIYQLDQLDDSDYACDTPLGDDDSQPIAAAYIRKWFTPDSITRLKRNQIFVFGSNLNGFHGGGAAAYAMQHFGAKWGEGVGITGQCYAIPTMHGGADDIRPYVEDFINYAQQHPELEFLVTPIGCGIAGFTPQSMAPLFKRALQYGNIVLPKSFVEVLTNH